PDTRSAAGAVGLLQLLPATARRAAVVLRRPPLRDEQLVDPGTAIDLGTWYLSEVVGRFGDPAIALAAYNAGPRAAAPWAIRGARRGAARSAPRSPARGRRARRGAIAARWGRPAADVQAAPHRCPCAPLPGSVVPPSSASSAKCRERAAAPARSGEVAEPPPRGRDRTAP